MTKRHHVQIEQRLLMPAAAEEFRLSVMTHDTTSHGIARGTSPLLRRVGGIELPVAGTWNVPGTHATLSFSVPQFLRRSKDLTGRAREATLVFSDDPGEVLVAVLFDAPGLDIARSTACSLPVHLEARSIRGPHRWSLSGEVFPGTGVLPLRATLDYHGVWRRGDHAYGWFVLAGTIGRHADVPQRRLRFNFDLLAYGPATARPAPARSLSHRVASQTRDAA
jgi:hypothetical protein